MYGDASKKVVLIEDVSSKWYEKAIFILKKDIPLQGYPKDLVGEAERIIEAYMKKNNRNYAISDKSQQSDSTVQAMNKQKGTVPIRKKNQIDWILNICLVLSCMLFVYYLFQILL